ncbi:CDP-alcohol phosphatidyltransferase family protein, partial [Streptomyces bacillaris]|uniref:CDP-alcohol phosphatidyltransferase family protein n=1 Tax=Streptomyces bacillaris TaxID=68179 RepID=UPI0034602A2B
TTVTARGGQPPVWMSPLVEEVIVSPWAKSPGLDPAADRLYILSTLLGLTWREILPLWLTAALLARELMLLVMVAILRRHGYPPPQVNFLGKAATFNLMYAFPLLLLSDGSGWLATVAAVFGWAFAGWGTTLYWWAGILYVVQVRRLVKADAVADPAR